MLSAGTRGKGPDRGLVGAGTWGAAQAAGAGGGGGGSLPATSTPMCMAGSRQELLIQGISALK